MATLDPREACFDRELARHNESGAAMVRSGIKLAGDPHVNHGPDEVVSFLKRMPEEAAIEKAREWTGREDIETLADAEAAVREALGNEPGVATGGM